MPRLPTIDRLSWKLGVSIALLVVGGQVAGFLLVHRTFQAQLLDATREQAQQETRLVRQALEHQMLDRDDRLIRAMVDGFARDRAFDRVMILDRLGEVRFSSDPAIRARHFRPDSPTCTVCHQHPAARRDRSAMLSIDGGTVLRCVEPIPNREACHGCHPADHRINGLVMVDVPIGGTLERLKRSVGTMALGTGAIGLMLLVGIGLVFRRLVLRRLFRFEGAARAIARGEMGRRVEVEGSDALTRVEQQFNAMADSIASLLAQVREQRANLERVMNSVDDGMVVLDPSRVVVAANDAFLRRFARPGEEVIGRPCCGPESGSICGGGGACPAVECARTRDVQTVVRERTLPDGSTRQEEVRASPVWGEGGRVTHVVEVWRDITERRSAEARLAESQRMVSLGKLAAGFSHEVNTPLASVATCLDGIRRLSGAAAAGAKEQAQIEEYARIAATQVRRCGAITEQFLALARGRSLGRDVVDLCACADSVARLCQHTAREAGAAIEVVPRPDVPAVAASLPAVQQVLLNLMLNALEACSKDPRIRVTFSVDREIEVRIEDNGRGIAPADLGRLFEPFFTRREKGTGLGLFVSMNLARSWGGDIRVESRLGVGSTFAVVFPRAATPGGQAP